MELSRSRFSKLQFYWLYNNINHTLTSAIIYPKYALYDVSDLSEPIRSELRSASTAVDLVSATNKHIHRLILSTSPKPIILTACSCTYKQLLRASEFNTVKCTGIYQFLEGGFLKSPKRKCLYTVNASSHLASFQRPTQPFLAFYGTAKSVGLGTSISVTASDQKLDAGRPQKQG